MKIWWKTIGKYVKSNDYIETPSEKNFHSTAATHKPRHTPNFIWASNRKNYSRRRKNENFHILNTLCHTKAGNWCVNVDIWHKYPKISGKNDNETRI